MIMCFRKTEGFGQEHKLRAMVSTAILLMSFEVEVLESWSIEKEVSLQP
jgi:hypothetical protein